MPRDGMKLDQATEIAAAVGQALARQRSAIDAAAQQMRQDLEARVDAIAKEGAAREDALRRAIEDTLAEHSRLTTEDVGQRLAALAERPALTEAEVREWMDAARREADDRAQQREAAITAAVESLLTRRAVELEQSIAQRLDAIAAEAGASATEIQRRQDEAAAALRAEAAQEAAGLAQALEALGAKLEAAEAQRAHAAAAAQAQPALTEEAVRGWLDEATREVAGQIAGVRALVEQQAGAVPDEVRAALAALTESVEGLRQAPRVTDEEVRGLVEAGNAAIAARVAAAEQQAQALAQSLPGAVRAALADMEKQPVLAEAEVRGWLEALADSIRGDLDGAATRQQERDAWVQQQTEAAVARADALAADARAGLDAAIARATEEARQMIDAARAALDAARERALQAVADDAVRQRASDLESTRGLMAQLQGMLDKAAARIESLRDGKDGRDGEKGEPGQRGPEGPAGLLPQASVWNQARSYQRGDVVRHRGGTFQAEGDPEGAEPGVSDVWRVLADGLFDLDIALSPDDPRKLVVTAQASSQATPPFEFTFNLGTPIWRGRWQADAAYQRGDLTGHDGSTWFCTEDAPTSEPGKGAGWSLMTARGRKGDKGDPGRPGDPGREGPPGVGIREIGEEDGSLIFYLTDGGAQTIKLPLPEGRIGPDSDEGAGTPIRGFRGAWKLGVGFGRGDVVRYNRGLWLATGAIPAGAIPGQEAAWVNLLTVPPGALVEHVAGGSTIGGYTQAEADDRFIEVTGDRMQGPLYLAGTPTNPAEAVSKDYVDQALASLASQPVVDQHARDAAATAQAKADAALPSAGGVMTGGLAIHNVPRIVLASAHGGTIPGIVSTVDGHLRWNVLLGFDNNIHNPAPNQGADFGIVRFDDAGAMIDIPMQISRQTGNAIFSKVPFLLGDPTEPLQAATKQYVDSELSGLSRAITFVGNANLSQPIPPATRKAGDFYFHNGPDNAVVDGTWPGIAGLTVNTQDAAVFDGMDWHILEGNIQQAHLDARYLPLTGGTLTGDLTVAPTAAEGRLTIDSTNSRPSGNSFLVLRSGDGATGEVEFRQDTAKAFSLFSTATSLFFDGYTAAGARMRGMTLTRDTGAVQFHAPTTGVAPTAATHFATKKYVDDAIAALEARIAALEAKVP